MKLSPESYTQAKGYKFKQGEDKKKSLLTELRLHKEVCRPRLAMRKFIDEKGFVHSKQFLCDDNLAIVGTINLDYRSLVHHFENGVWLYKTSSISDIKIDMEKTIGESIYIEPNTIKVGLMKRILRSIVRIFAPLL